MFSSCRASSRLCICSATLGALRLTSSKYPSGRPAPSLRMNKRTEGSRRGPRGPRSALGGKVRRDFVGHRVTAGLFSLGQGIFKAHFWVIVKVHKADMFDVRRGGFGRGVIGTSPAGR